MPKFLKSFFSAHYTILLLLLFLLFIFRPYGSDFVLLGIWQILMTGAILSALFNANHNRQVKITASILAVPTVLLCWINLIHPNSAVFIANVIFIAAFLTLVTSSIIYHVVVRARVTMETLRGVICAYLMVAFLFAYLYWLVEFLSPGSFILINRAAIFSYAEYLSELIYFSFITILTVGFGDITPVKDVAQTFVVFEGILGQFYIAVLVARLVAVYTLTSDKTLIQELKILGNKKTRM